MLDAACGASTPKPAPNVKGPTVCDSVPDHENSLMTASQKVPSEQLDPFRSVLARPCTRAGWSAATQHCLLATKTIADGNACEKLMTPEQAQALERDGEAAVQDVEAPGSAQ